MPLSTSINVSCDDVITDPSISRFLAPVVVFVFQNAAKLIVLI